MWFPHLASCKNSLLSLKIISPTDKIFLNLLEEEIELGLENLDEIAGDYSDTYQEDLERCAAERIAQRESQGKWQ